MLLAERIERLLVYRDAAAAHDPNVQSELVDLWRILGKDICRTCPDKLYGAMIDLRKINLETMSKRVSQIKDGEFIMIPFTSDSYTNANLTDAIARKMLTEYPALASSFKKLPPDEPQEGDEDYVDAKTVKAQADADKKATDKQTSLAEENEKLKKELAELKKKSNPAPAASKPATPAEGKTAAPAKDTTPAPLPESVNDSPANNAK